TTRTAKRADGRRDAGPVVEHSVTSGRSPRRTGSGRRRNVSPSIAGRKGAAMSTSSNPHHRVLIVGGGSGGISVAARLRHAGMTDVGLIDPANTHYYQPLWTLVGGGRASVGETARAEATVMPPGVAGIKDAAQQIDPDEQTVRTASGIRVSYEYLVVCPGNQLDWTAIPGMAEALATP